jgi:transposase
MPGRGVLELSGSDREELERRVRSRSGRVEDARRARVLLMLAEGATYDAIQASVGCGRAYVTRWRDRFEAEGLGGLYSRYKGAPRRVLTAAIEARILAKTRTKPSDGSTHWTTRKLGRELGIHHMAVQRVWARAGIKPHRIERYMASDDPNFETKAADILALYLNPPQHAAVFCVDEKSHIQALDRLDPVLPFSPGRLERHGFEYYRHGTLSLLAALNTKTGEVVGHTVPRHTSAEFVAFLAQVVAHEPRGREIHIVLDNLSTHKTQRVRDFLAEHPGVHLHFTPTYSSWLNQVEIWFGKIERDVIARGVFTSTKDLARKLVRYIRRYNQAPTPIKWSYSDPTHRIRTTSSTSTVTGH